VGAETQQHEGEPAGSNHERQRAAIVGVIPPRYSPVVHFLFPAVLGLAAMVGALVRLHSARPVELLTLPITLILAFGFEWRVHQVVLHRRMPLVGTLYERHELQHHVVYVYDDLQMRSAREAWLIMMPPYAVVLVFLLDLPLALAAGALLGANVGCLFLATSMLFFLSYEWLHLAYHLPEESAIGRARIIARLREHHRRHHDPRLMKRWNFNVTLPLFDWVHRTVWSPERERERDNKRAGRRRAAAAAGH
jgi:hypothetical protein